jgi:hypothetical protein
MYGAGSYYHWLSRFGTLNKNSQPALIFKQTMNDNIPEWRLHRFYQTRIPIFNGTSANQTGLIALSRALEIIEHGENGHKAKVLDIQSKLPILTRDEYKAQKNHRLQHVSIHCRYNNQYRDGDNAIDFTGIVLIDFDDVPIHDVDSLKRTLIEYPFVIAAYKSVSGKGVHAWVYCKGVEDIEDYKAVWRQLAITFYNNHSIKVCDGSNSITQLVCLSYDPNILYNTNPSPWRYRIDDDLEADYYRTFGKKKDIGKGEDIDLPSIDVELYQHFYSQFIEGNYYWNMILVDKEKGAPIPFIDAAYDPEQHSFKKAFSKDIISRCKFKNQSNTVGKWEYKFAALKLSINGNRKVVDGSRKSTLMSWLSTYALILRVNGQNISLVELLTLAHVLNDHICYDEYYHQSPIVIRHLHFVINNVWAIIQQNRFQPTFHPLQHIYNYDMMIECGTGAKNETFQSIYFSEIRKLSKNKHKVDVHFKLNQFEKSVPAGQIENITKKKELYARIANFHQVDYYTARNWINLVISDEGIRKGNHHILSMILLNIARNDTFSKLELQINQMIADNEYIKQKDVIKFMAKDISSASVKRHWKDIKERVDAHNQSLVELNFQAETLTANKAITGTKRWFIYKRDRKTIIAYKLDASSTRMALAENRTYVNIDSIRRAIGRTIWAQQS